MIEDKDNDNLTWKRVDTTSQGYPVYQCIECPGILRIAVPWDKWQELYRGQNCG